MAWNLTAMVQLSSADDFFDMDFFVWYQPQISPLFPGTLDRTVTKNTHRRLNSNTMAIQNPPRWWWNLADSKRDQQKRNKTFGGRHSHYSIKLAQPSFIDRRHQKLNVRQPREAKKAIDAASIDWTRCSFHVHKAMGKTIIRWSKRQVSMQGKLASQPPESIKQPYNSYGGESSHLYGYADIGWYWFQTLSYLSIINLYLSSSGGSSSSEVHCEWSTVLPVDRWMIQVG